MSALLDKAGAYWNTLSRRDRRLLVVMVSAIVLFVGYFAVTGVRSRVHKLETSVASKQRDLELIQHMTGSISENRATIEEMRADMEKYKGFSVSGFLESTGEELKIAESITNINDQGLQEGNYFDEHRYEVVMKKVTLEQLVNYLYKIQSAEQPLRVEKLKVRTNTRNREEISSVNIDVVFSKIKMEG